MSDPVYLDYNATTPVAPEVLEAMLPWLREQFGNASSSHAFGKRAAAAVSHAREQVADMIGAHADEVVFTGCATESNNLAVLGVAGAQERTSDGARGDARSAARRHIIISAIEHPAVTSPAVWLRDRGWRVTIVPVDTTGRIQLEPLEEALGPDTALVSVMHANNEVGTVQPIARVAQLARARGSVMHTDAAQSAGKLSLHVDDLGVDLLTLAGHKFYAPKGVGALYVRRGTHIQSILYGAGQEHGLRPGTENVALIVALGAAAALVTRSLKPTPGAPAQVNAQMLTMRDRLHARLCAAIPGLSLNGHPDERLPNTLHLSFPRVSGRTLLSDASTIVAASVGSACHSQHDVVSGVLAAMGLDATRAAGAVRLSVGWMTTEDEVDRAADGLVASWERLASQGA
jgi:cysteine desulfurase